jgi:hypothetical protein
MRHDVSAALGVDRVSFAVAAPILAHLLARRSCAAAALSHRAVPAAAIQTPISRDRLTDIGLLVVRCLILAAAVAALAQPVWLTADRRRTLGESIARAIVIDSGVATAADPLAAHVVGGSRPIARVAHRTRPRNSWTEATTWLAQQPMRREIVLVSDFPVASIAKADLDRIPAGIGIKLVQVSASGASHAAVALREGPASDRCRRSPERLAARDAALAQVVAVRGGRIGPLRCCSRSRRT